VWRHRNNRAKTLARLTARRAATFLGDGAGSTVVVFALSVPILVVAAGMAVDYSLASATRTKMQGVADSAATASARELQLARSDATRITAIATNVVNASLQNVSITVNVDFQAMTVNVVIQKQHAPVTGTLLSNQPIQLTASATAKMSGSMPLCMLALNSSSSETISLQDSAVMNAPGCLVQTNSNNKFAMDSHDSAVLKAGMICSAGGTLKFVSSNFSPAPTTDCPVLPDPLNSRAPPSVGACNYTNTVVDGLSQTLQPGVYCGGLTVTNNANVNMAPGIFTITGGPLVVSGGSTLTGTYVGIYLSGANANLTFDADTTISLSAPTSGQLAGILIYDDPSGAAAPAITPPSGLVCNSMAKKAQYSVSPRQHQIYSNNAQTLTGTIYMPKGEVLIDASKPIANYSAYTVLVVDQLHLCAGPTLVLNTNYTATDVPVPMGVGPFGAKIFLSN
jgi:Flp pilus assembly protein TadG